MFIRSKHLTVLCQVSGHAFSWSSKQLLMWRSSSALSSLKCVPQNCRGLSVLAGLWPSELTLQFMNHCILSHSQGFNQHLGFSLTQHGLRNHMNCWAVNVTWYKAKNALHFSFVILWHVLTSDVSMWATPTWLNICYYSVPKPDGHWLSWLFFLCPSPIMGGRRSIACHAL